MTGPCSSQDRTNRWVLGTKKAMNEKLWFKPCIRYTCQIVHPLFPSSVFSTFSVIFSIFTIIFSIFTVVFSIFNVWFRCFNFLREFFVLLQEFFILLQEFFVPDQVVENLTVLYFRRGYNIWRLVPISDEVTKSPFWCLVIIRNTAYGPKSLYLQS